MAEKHAGERKVLQEAQYTRWKAETLQRQARFRQRLRGLFDRLNGYHRRIKGRNEQEIYEALKRDRQEPDALIFQRLDQRRALQARMERLQKPGDARSQSLSRDRDQYEEINARQREVAEIEERKRTRRFALLPVPGGSVRQYDTRDPRRIGNNDGSAFDSIRL